MLSSISVTGSKAKAIDADPNRVAMILQNQGTEDIYLDMVDLGENLTTSVGYRLRPDDSIELSAAPNGYASFQAPITAFPFAKNEIWAISASGTPTLHATGQSIS